MVERELRNYNEAKRKVFYKQNFILKIKWFFFFFLKKKDRKIKLKFWFNKYKIARIPIEFSKNSRPSEKCKNY
jgi:hypothetical protein